MFTDFLKPNTKTNILSLLKYDDETETLVSDFASGVVIPFNDALSLNNTLEFTLYDSKYQLVTVNDGSQLFLKLSLL